MTLSGSFIRFPRCIISIISFLLCLVLLMPAAAVTGGDGESSETLWRFSLNNQTYIDIADVISFDAGTNGGGGGPHNLALKSGGTVWAWGYNSQGELGNGVTNSGYFDTIYQVLGPGGSGYLSDVTAVSAGNGFSLALKTDGTVWAWGGNYVGQLGIGNSGYDNSGANYITTPVQVTGLPAIKAISAGESHSLALDFDGQVWAWGANYYGQAGVNVAHTDHGLSSNYIRFYCETPVLVNVTDIQSISAGGFSSMALDDSGNIWNWGNNTWGQLGQNDTSSRYTPVKVKGVGGSGFLENITLISAGYSHSLAFASGSGIINTLYAWGSNYVGQLGDGTTTERRTPIVTATLPTADGGGGFPSGGSLQISAGLINSIVKNPSGSITAWGSGFGTLEYIGYKYGNSPVLLDTIHDATFISAGAICLVLGPGRSASSVTIQSSGNPSSGGEEVTFTASVSGTSGYPVTGNVDFYLNNGIGNLPATKNSDGTYSYTIPWDWFAAGMNNKIVARYSGDYNNLPSTSNDYWQFVGKLDSTTVLASTPNPSDDGETVTFSVTVSGPAGKPVPSGEISFSNGIFSSLSLDLEGKAEFNSSALAVGTATITAYYSGDSKYNSSSSSPVDHVVTPAVIQPGTHVIIDRAGWIDSGIDLQPGDVVDITATGLMRFYHPSGWYFDVSPEGQWTYEPDFLIDGSLTWIALIGRLDGNNFEIGTGLNFTVNSPGRLYLAANNDYFTYDSGSWDVQIVITPAGSGTGQLRTYSMINGRAMWTDSGVDIQAGDEVALSASGLIYFSNQGWFLGPEGTGYTDPSALIDANLNLNSLVGCIGDPASSDIFYIGKSYAFQSSLSGRLWLGVNAAGFDNQHSSWDVNIDINITPYAITPDSLPDGM